MAGNLTAMIASIFSGSAVSTDPYFNLTTLLLSTTATNGQQNNTFQDSSTNNLGITRNGNTTQGTFSPFSQTGWGNYFNGSYLTVPSGADFNLGTNDFCIEFWLNPITPATYGGILTFDDGDYPLNFSYASANSSNLQANFGTTSAWLYTAFFDTSTATNEWAHYVATRSGSTFRLFKNGVLKATGTSSGTIGNSSNNIRINANGGSAGTTYISNLRIINGSIPTTYQTSSTTTGTTIFTVPTSPLTTTSQGATAADVKLLTCQSNRFIDNSTANPKTISLVTANSTPSVVPFSPFNPTSAWSASTVGGSGYFDGTGDYLQAANNAAFDPGSGDWSCECWFYPTHSSGADKVILGNLASGSTGWDLMMPTPTTFTFRYYDPTYRDSGSLAVVGNAWTHVAVCKTSTRLSVFINGTRAFTTTSFVTITSSANPFRVGASNLNNPFQGYIAGTRIVKGSTPYDPASTTISLPTSPPTAITNTVFLLNFTNSGIYDATSKNVLETVGNAQASTAITPKWGTTSMLFNSDTSYLQQPASVLYGFGTGNFTVECWFYLTASPTTEKGLFHINTAVNNTVAGYAVSTTTTGFTFYAAGTSYASTTTAPVGQWNHLAYVRNSGTVNVYLNGSLIQNGSKADSQNLTNPLCYVGLIYTTASGSLRYLGYMQDFRVTRGYARYTANFTPPTAAFPVQ